MDTETNAKGRNPAAVFLGSMSPGTQCTYGFDLKAIAYLLGSSDPFTYNWAALRFEDTHAIRKVLIENVGERTGVVLAPITINRILCALRGVLKTAWRMEQMSAEDYYRSVDIENVKGETLPAGRQLDGDEITNLMEVCAAKPTPAGIRDGAIVALMYSCGLRRSEVVNLDLIDYDPSTDKLTVSGKRNKERTAYLVNGAKQAMDDWLTIRGNQAGPLFTPINKAGKLLYRRLNSQAIYNMLARRGKKAGMSHYSPHDLRHTFVSHLLDAGVDISTVAKLAGHKSVTTTARYDRRPDEVQRKAVELIHVPYRGRNGKKETPA
jgi:integrase/recombinase XerD